MLHSSPLRSSPAAARCLAAAMLAMAAAPAWTATYEAGYRWNRAAQWVNGPTVGAVTGNPGLDTKGSAVWSYLWTEGDGLGAETPWYETDKTLMLWDEPSFAGSPTRYRWSRTSFGSEPAVNRYSITHSRTPRNGGAPYQALTAWTNPAGDGAIVNINGRYSITWAGDGHAQLPDYVAEVAFVKYSVDTDTYTPLLVQSFDRPDVPVSTNRWVVEQTLSFNNVRFDAGDTLYVSINNPAGVSAPRAAWLLMGDKVNIRLARYDTVTAVPEPATWASMALGLAAVAGIAARRRRAA